ncbi:MAG: SCO family protein, partial [Burkholderiaceae bacterium]
MIRHPTSSIRLALFGALALALSAPASRAADDPHAHHRHADPTPGYKRQLANYRIPELSLVRSDGKSVPFQREIDDGRPVVLNLIFTTCTAVCPLLSQTVAQFRRKLGADAAAVHFISVSIDPEQDTPERLRAYAAQFGADKDWTYFTGSVSASVTLQKGFQAYFGDTMHHRPVTFMRAA